MDKLTNRKEVHSVYPLHWGCIFKIHRKLIYKLIVSHSNYQAAQEWFLEDEYERVKGKLLAEEIM